MPINRALLIAGLCAFTLSACASHETEGNNGRPPHAEAQPSLEGAVIAGKTSDRRSRDLVADGTSPLAASAARRYMDQQEAELTRKLRSTDVNITRVGNALILRMPGSLAFASGSSRLNPKFDGVLDDVAAVLRKYERTLVDVTGHTDSEGSKEINDKLSLARAKSVAAYLIARGPDGRRFLVRGIGSREPIATNKTAAGRAQNRRVTIKLTPIVKN